MTHRDMPLADLVAHLRHAGSVWFKNYDLLLLEELIRRVQRTAGAPKEPDDGQRKQHVPDVPAGGGADVRGWRSPTESPGGDRDGLTEEEIAQIESHARGAFASLLQGSTETEVHTPSANQDNRGRR